jgi:hypothetical protein
MARAVHAPAVRPVSRPGLIQRCGGIDCPPGVCDHTDDPADAAVHRSADAAEPVGGNGVPAPVLRVLGMAGTPLDTSTRASMEARLGHALFDVDTDQQLDPDQLEVAPGETVTFLLGFPRIPYGQADGEVSVGIRLTGSPTPVEAESPVQLIRRRPA